MLRILVRSFISFVLALLSWQVQSASIYSESVWYKFSQGFRSDANVALFPKSTSPSTLSQTNASDWAQDVLSLNTQIERIMSDDRTRIVVIAHRRKIVAEHYSSRWLRRTTPLGFSMSKSMTALTIGKAICDGKIENPNSAIAQSFPTLSGTSWGDASVYDILGMKSGAAKTATTGWQSDSVQGEFSGLYTGAMQAELSEVLKRYDTRFAKSGSSHQYNNLDTIALSLLLDGKTGSFAKYFREAVWDDIGAETDGAWITNSGGQLAGYTGFSASPHDWVRIGFYVLDRLKRSDCYASFLKQAVTNVSTAEQPGRCYGYQFWTWCKDPGAFFFTGAEGQYLIVFPNNEIVAYVHQINEENSRRLLPLIHEYRRLLR